MTSMPVRRRLHHVLDRTAQGAAHQRSAFRVRHLRWEGRQCGLPRQRQRQRGIFMDGIRARTGHDWKADLHSFTEPNTLGAFGD